MKITVIGPTYPYKGGISHFTTILVRTLRKDNEVQFLSWKRQYPSFLYPVELKDTKSKIPVKEDAKFFLDFYNPFSWISAALDIKKNKSDLLILSWASPIQSPIYSVIGILIHRFTKTKIIFICHNVLPHEPTAYDVPLIKYAFKYGDTFIVHSTEDKKKLEKLVKNKKIIHGFLPIFDMFNKKTSASKENLKKKFKLEERVLLYFGYIRPYKGLMYLLEAMPHILLDHPKTSLLVVGQFWSKDKEKYLEKVDDLGITKNVSFVDHYVPDEELVDYFEVSDVVVLPYIEATQSASVQTAYAFNKPVISTSVGGLGDVVEDGVTGYVIQPKNSMDISDKIKLFYKNTIPKNNIIKLKLIYSWDKYKNYLISTK